MVRADVALTGLDGDAKAVVGSFTVDGLTYAIDGEGQAALVAVAPLGGGEGKAEADASSAAFGEGAEDSGAEGARAEADGATLTLPAAVSYGGTDYSLMRIAPLALDGCGAAALSIPASVETVDTAAALGCDTLAEVTVAEDNPAFSVLDGYLADKAQTSILLVPEGRVGQLRIPQSVQAVDPRVFSHCTRVTDLVVDAGCPGLTSWNGSICTSDLATLVRVPAGARTVTLPSECSAIGASAFSGCTELESIEVQGNVESIAPSAFGEIEEATPLVAQSDTARITGLVAVANSALSSIQIDKASIAVTLPDGADPSVWESAGFTHVASSKGDETTTDLGEAEGSAPGTLASSVISEDVALSESESYAATHMTDNQEAIDEGEPYVLYGGKSSAGGQSGILTSTTGGSAWWEVTVAEAASTRGTLRIHCEGGATIARSNTDWRRPSSSILDSPSQSGAWGNASVRAAVERIKMDQTVLVQETTTASTVQGPEIYTGMAHWFSYMPNLVDISGVFIPEGVRNINGLFFCCKSLPSMSGRYGSFALKADDEIWNIHGVFGYDRSLATISPQFRIPESTKVMQSLFLQCISLRYLPDGLSIPAGCTNTNFAFAFTFSLTGLPSSLVLSGHSSLPAGTSLSFQSLFGTRGKKPGSVIGDGFSEVVPNTVFTFANTELSNLYPGPTGTADYARYIWSSEWHRTLMGPDDLAANNRYGIYFEVLPPGSSSKEAYCVNVGEGERIEVMPEIPADSLVDFCGWFYRDAEGKEHRFRTDIAASEQLHFSDNRTATVYAGYDGYAITYLDGVDAGTEISDSLEVSVDPEFFLQPTFHSGEKVIIDAVPVREGYEFLGWTIEGITGDTPQKQAVIPAGTTGDKVAVAHWAELPKKNYLYTVKDGSGAAGSTLPQAWWTLDNNGRLYIQCDSENGETAVIAQRNFPDWWYNNPDRKEAWGAVRDQVRSIVISESFEVEQSATYTYEHVRANASSSDCREARNEGMSWWFTRMPNLKDISGLRIPDGIVCAGLFWGSWGLETLEGAYGTFQMPESCGNWNGLLGSTALKELPEGFTIPNGVFVSRCLFQGAPLSMLPEGFSIPSSVIVGSGIFKNCPELSSLPESLKLYGISSDNSMFRFDATQDVASYPREYVEWYKQRAGGGILPAKPVRTLYAGNLADLLPSGASGTAKDYWLASYNRELVGPGDLASPQAAVRFQVPKADGSGYVSYDVLADSSGRVTAPAVTRYGYSKVTWRYDTGASGAELGHVAVSGPCGSEGLAFEASVLPDIEAGLKGPVYAEVSGLMLSMDMPVGSGNLWYAIDCGEVMALGPSASTRAGMEDAHELSFESYTPVPTKLSATFTANDAADGTPAAEKLFPNGLDEGTGFALSLDGGASESAGLKALIGAGGSQGFSSLASLDASPSAREPGRASGTLALKLGGANDVDFAEEATEYSVADIVWTLDASAQYDFWATDDVATYSAYEIKQAAEAISAYGATADVPAFRQYDRYLKQQSPDADPVFSIKVYDQPDGTASTHKVDVLGIAQDTKASGGKAGLTFGFKDAYLQGTNDCRMRSTATNSGGWNSSDLKKYLNGTFVSYLGASVSEGIVVAAKRQQQYGSSSLQATNDAKLFVPSYFEVYGISYAYWNGNETASNSFQYANFAKGGQSTENTNALKSYGSAYIYWWLRSASKTKSTDFARVSNSGICNDGSVANLAANSQNGIVPCFCF